jgi:hypothetical protein
MSEWLPIAEGVALALTGWVIPRCVAKARLKRLPAVVLDLSPVLLGFGLLLTATGRPIFAGVVLLSLGAGFAFVDRTKRAALREPVVFSDMSELPHVFTHPQLYLPYAGLGLVIGGAFAMIALGLLVLYFDHPWSRPNAPLAALAVAAVWAAGWVAMREPVLGLTAKTLRRLEPT